MKPNLLHQPPQGNNPPKNPPNTKLDAPKPPTYKLKLQYYPITQILNKKYYERKDKYGTIKKFTSFKCAWMQQNNQSYIQWLPINKLFPKKKPQIDKYYDKKQLEYFKSLINKHFYQIQNCNSRYIQESLYLPLVQITTKDCNLNRYRYRYTTTNNINY
jgi:hypothetical protein